MAKNHQPDIVELFFFHFGLPILIVWWEYPVHAYKSGFHTSYNIYLAMKLRPYLTGNITIHNWDISLTLNHIWRSSIHHQYHLGLLQPSSGNPTENPGGISCQDTRQGGVVQAERGPRTSSISIFILFVSKTTIQIYPNIHFISFYAIWCLRWVNGNASFWRFCVNKTIYPLVN